MSITIPPVMSPAAPASNPGTPWQAAGLWMAMAGAITGTIGAFYGAKAEQYQAKSAALDQRFAASMASINARQAEQDAQQLLRAGEQEIGALGLAAAAERGAMQVDVAASGIEAGTGSAAEAAASLELRRKIDELSIRSNVVRAAGQARMGATNQRNQQLLSSVSANNLERSARTISPGLRAAGAAMQGAGYMAPHWYDYRRRM